jgi:TetR/AcrR family transcriptional repressor of mexJK operon
MSREKLREFAMAADQSLLADAVGQRIRRRGPGRPKDSAKRAAIITAASTLFLSQGFETVRMDEVAVAAGVSKMTVYSHFQDKAALFAACVQATGDDLLANAEAISAPFSNVDLERTLIAFGMTVLKLALDPKTANLHRMLSTKLIEHPDMAVAIHNAAVATHNLLAKILLSATERGEIKVDIASEAAEYLLSIWQGDLSQSIASGFSPPLTEAEIEKRVKRGTAMFLRAYDYGNTL